MHPSVLALEAAQGNEPPGSGRVLSLVQSASAAVSSSV